MPDDMRLIEGRWLHGCSVAAQGMLAEYRHAGGQHGVMACRADEDMPCVVRADGEPVRIVEGPAIHTAGPGESLERQIQLGTADCAEVDIDKFAASLRAGLVDSGDALGDAQIV